MLGNERRWHMFSDVALHEEAARLFAKLGIPVRDTTLPIRALSGGQRQMVAVARAMAHNPRLLLLDEPTASLGMQEAALVERLITRLREQGTTILLSCHDTGLMFRLSDRIVVLRHGRVVTEVSTDEVHPDDVMALIAGQAVDSSARRQLTRLHGLTGRLVSSDPSSSLSLILSALGAALGSERLCIHLVDEGQLTRTASFGVPERLLDAWARLPFGAAGGPVGLAAERQAPVIEDNIKAVAGSWQDFGDLARSAKVASSWSVPVLGPGGLLGRHHRVPGDAGQAPPRRPRPGRALRRLRRQRDRARPAARPGDGAQPAARDDQGDPADAGGRGAGRGRPVGRAAGPAAQPRGRRGGAGHRGRGRLADGARLLRGGRADRAATTPTFRRRRSRRPGPRSTAAGRTASPPASPGPAGTSG